MKKVTFLTCVLALCTSTMFAQTLEVTTADMDPGSSRWVGVCD